MTRSDFLKKIEGLLELPASSLTGSEELRSIPAWDSLSLMGFIAIVHSSFGLKIPGKRIMECKTVNDLIAVAGDKISGE